MGRTTYIYNVNEAIEGGKRDLERCSVEAFLYILRRQPHTVPRGFDAVLEHGRRACYI